MGIQYNIYSGLCAALNGVFLKSAFSISADGPVLGTIIPFIQTALSIPDEKMKMQFLQIPEPVATDVSPLLILRIVLHIVLAVAAISITGMMHFYFAKSMNEIGAAKATVYNFSINFIGTIFFSWSVFGEAVTQRLMAGVVFMLIGTFIISSIDLKEIKTKVEDKDSKKNK